MLCEYSIGFRCAYRLIYLKESVRSSASNIHRRVFIRVDVRFLFRDWLKSGALFYYSSLLLYKVLLYKRQSLDARIYVHT